jgi:signal-transduction protein with cAMP-binding, CBS, and nucleotidyltransferase domain
MWGTRLVFELGTLVEALWEVGDVKCADSGAHGDGTVMNGSPIWWKIVSGHLPSEFDRWMWSPTLRRIGNKKIRADPRRVLGESARCKLLPSIVTCRKLDGPT